MATLMILYPPSENLSAANYDFPPENFVNGNLTITAKSISVIADPQTNRESANETLEKVNLVGTDLVTEDDLKGW